MFFSTSVTLGLVVKCQGMWSLHWTERGIEDFGGLTFESLFCLPWKRHVSKEKKMAGRSDMHGGGKQWQEWQQVLVNRARPRVTGRTRPPPVCVNHSCILGQRGHLTSRTTSVDAWPAGLACGMELLLLALVALWGGGEYRDVMLSTDWKMMAMAGILVGQVLSNSSSPWLWATTRYLR